MNGEGSDEEWMKFAEKLKAAAAERKGAERRGPEEEESVELEEPEAGQRPVKKMMDPKLPSAEDVRMHNLLHMPYRSWCPHCVRGRGKEMECRKGDKEAEPGLPEYHLDYCFPGDEEGQKLTVLVMVERYTKMKKAVVVPSKGSTGRYAARMALELIDECGDKDRDVILKTDQEAAILFLVDDICTSRTGARTIVEQVPKKSKGSNGVVERAVQSVEQFLRTLKSALDQRMGVRVDTRHPVLTWLCEYASVIMNRAEVAADGKTAYERCKGKKIQMMGLEFAEKVLWKFPAKGPKLEKLNARWGYGIFIGVRVKSNELIVVDAESKGLVYVRTVRRIPEEQRWDAKNLELVSMVPWNRGTEDREADGDVPEFDVKAGPGRRLTTGEVEEIATRVDKHIVHRAHLKKSDFQQFGFTDRCPGCSAMIRGLHAQPHAEHCRRRLEKLLEGDLRIKNAKARLREKGKLVREESEEGSAKRRKLEDIEEAAMAEEDPVKLMELFEAYRAEYTKMRDNDDDSEAKRRKTGEKEDPMMEAPSSPQARRCTSR
jgi:hypothetical protein